MLSVIRLTFILLSLFAGRSAAYNGCRQCYGSLEVNFQTQVTQAQATNFMSSNLEGCATGNQIAILGYSNPTNDCAVGASPPRCKIWNISMRVWRYCGNGGVLKVNKVLQCFNNICSNFLNLDMTCTKSVGCIGKCDAAACSK